MMNFLAHSIQLLFAIYVSSEAGQARTALKEDVKRRFDRMIVA